MLLQERAAKKDAHERSAREGERSKLLSQLQEKHQEEAFTADAHIRAAAEQVIILSSPAVVAACRW